MGCLHLVSPADFFHADAFFPDESVVFGLYRVLSHEVCSFIIQPPVASPAAQGVPELLNTCVPGNSWSEVYHEPLTVHGEGSQLILANPVIRLSSTHSNTPIVVVVGRRFAIILRRAEESNPHTLMCPPGSNRVADLSAAPSFTAGTSSFFSPHTVEGFLSSLLL